MAITIITPPRVFQPAFNPIEFVVSSNVAPVSTTTKFEAIIQRSGTPANDSFIVFKFVGYELKLTFKSSPDVNKLELLATSATTATRDQIKAFFLINKYFEVVSGAFSQIRFIARNPGIQYRLDFEFSSPSAYSLFSNNAASFTNSNLKVKCGYSVLIEKVFNSGNFTRLQEFEIDFDAAAQSRVRIEKVLQAYFNENVYPDFFIGFFSSIDTTFFKRYRVDFYENIDGEPLRFVQSAVYFATKQRLAQINYPIARSASITETQWLSDTKLKYTWFQAHEYLSFVVFNRMSQNIFVFAELFFLGGTSAIQYLYPVAISSNNQAVIITAGAAMVDIMANHPNETLIAYKIYIESVSNVIISPKIEYRLQPKDALQFTILYYNHNGGIETLHCKGTNETALTVEREKTRNYLQANYSAAQLQEESTVNQTRQTFSASTGMMSKQRADALIEFFSTHKQAVYVDYENQRHIPISLLPGTFKLTEQKTNKLYSIKFNYELASDGAITPHNRFIGNNTPQTVTVNEQL